MMKLKPLLVLAIMMVGATGVALAADGPLSGSVGSNSAVTDNYGDAGDDEYSDGNGSDDPVVDDGGAVDDQYGDEDEGSSDNEADDVSDDSADDQSADMPSEDAPSIEGDSAHAPSGDNHPVDHEHGSRSGSGNQEDDHS